MTLLHNLQNSFKSEAVLRWQQSISTWEYFLYSGCDTSTVDTFTGELV